jgi:hypothetical protein
MTEEVSSAARLEWGAASQALPGETVCGDAWLVQPFAGGTLAAAIDGLGHGQEAACASGAACALLKEHPHEPLTTLLQRCHAALRTTRGAVISLACFRAAGLEWVGVGNVEGLLLHAGQGPEPAGESIMLHSGLVGMNLPALRPSLARLAPGDTLILTTDGIRNDFPRKSVLSDRPQQAAERICGRYAKGTDDALVLVVRYLGP